LKFQDFSKVFSEKLLNFLEKLSNIDFILSDGFELGSGSFYRTIILPPFCRTPFDRTPIDRNNI
jgi:hypothetical protein